MEYAPMHALMVLKRAGIYKPRLTPSRYHGVKGGDHIFMVAGYYYAVDLITNTWRQTA